MDTSLVAEEGESEQEEGLEDVLEVGVWYLLV